MIIRDEQINAFEQYAQRSLVDRLIADLRKDYAAAVKRVPDDLLRQRVEYAIERARQRELTSQRSIAAFVFLMFAVAPRFDEHRRVRRVLGSNPLPPAARISFLLTAMSGPDWDQVRSEDGVRAWPPHLRGATP